MTLKILSIAAIAALVAAPLPSHAGEIRDPQAKAEEQPKAKAKARTKAPSRKPASQSASGASAPPVGPSQSSAERTADPEPLKHDAPTGEPKR